MQALPKTNSSAVIPGLNGLSIGPFEDGEVSEDRKMEDMYEPMKAQQDPITIKQIEHQVQLGPQSNDDRDRSRSYSPYLSPREISQPGDAFSDHGTQSKTSLDVSTVPVYSQKPLPTTPDQSKLLNNKDLEAAKKQAQDAILRLWPLNIRFHNYVTEGVDEELLKSLFKDLGLNLTETISSSPKPSTKETTSSEGISSPKTLVVEAKNAPNTTPTTVDPSESRKDRIARLLAAKGARQSSTVAPSPKVSVAPKAIQAVATSIKPTLTQSEKSKLLQQKVEALKRAREALHEGKAPRLDDKKSFSKGDSTLEAPKAASSDGSNTRGNDAPASVIPGLSCSPTKQVTELPGAIQQPMATSKGTGLKHVRLAPVFDQNTQSRPFLIDVSEEEDGADVDEEMEVDSPGQVETSADMRGALHVRDPLLRDTPTLADSATARHVRSPQSITTPLRSTSRSNGSDLESMNKQIHEMKRKIAEAEARKRGKSSGPGSPALYQPNDSSLDDSSDSPNQPVAPSRFYGELGHGNSASVRLRSERRSRSRAASERLPLIEARRREHQTKLRALQSEIDRIQQELEEGMLEEQRLKEEMLDADSEKETGEATPADVPGSDENALGFMQESISSKPAGLNGQSTAGKSEEDQATGPPDDLQNMNSAGCSSRALDAVGESNVAHDGIGNTTTLPGSNNMISEEWPDNHELASSNSHSFSVLSGSLEDIEMEDAGYSADEDVEEDSGEDHEPPGAKLSAVGSDEGLLKQNNATLSQTEGLLEVSPVPSDSAAVPQKSSGEAEAGSANGHDKPSSSKSSFVPYETPLHYFHAYRFHPSFSKDVAGGLRSITYSNKIDVKKELCPDELTGQQCPRGNRCMFQHFETMQAPDDQILLQLGAADHYDEDQQQRYIAGLRRLLTEFRTRKVKDFDTISQGIVEFRARFLGDKTKILPLGSVTV
ncbi:hypothetical protein ED733_004495 [Metarhizium rileyi]|uniref:C3H1-type domain-containing protein n=1 Tax=Metarhizium rileyi (strain RCEF 4871) TaxID=1649241 RepID=A0A5C6GDX0_METRR|nr:hypothetical protein ED733_004495 [Metarhizium rileyi]